MKFYRCKKCPNLVIKLSVGACTPRCCGEEMEVLEPNTQEAAVEKHKPVLVEEDGKYYAVVGSVLHPHTPEHYIDWVLAEYEDHYSVYPLGADKEPKVALEKRPSALYAYCNLHGLWKND